MKIAFLVPDNRDEFRRYDDPEPYFGPAPTALLEGFELLASECEVHVVCCVQHPLRAPAQIGRNIFFHALPVGKWGWLRGGYLGCVAAIRRCLRQLQPDIVHGQGTERYPALAVALSGFPNVVTIHGNMRSVARSLRARPFSFHDLAAKLERFTLPRAGGVFCNSAYTEQQVRLLARRMWRVPNALRAIFFKPGESREMRPQPVLLNVGHFSPYKRQLEVLMMAESLWKRGCRFKLLFIGKNDVSTSYGRAFADRLAATEHLGFAECLGSRCVDEIVTCFDAADALVHCPTEEAFGLVVAEALARNLKVFGSSVGGVVDIATGVEGAELYPSEDWDALAAAVHRWCESGYPHPIGAAGEMRTRYHPEHVARRHLEIYAELLGTLHGNAERA